MTGVLVYSDPPLSQHEASLRSPAFPAGFSRPEGSVHRGSVQLVSLYPGDPLTPGFPSTANATYLSKSEVSDILPSIPATVIRADQAAHILASLGGDVAPTSWQLGNVKVDGGYLLGDDDETRVNLFVDMDDRIAPIWNVIGTIEGSEEPDKYVLVGNRRDAWVCGAIDPSSGSSTMLEIARGFGELLNKGWRPRRTIKFASWDGEEYGQLGSTEYAEENEQDLLKNAVAYITVDATAGPFTQGMSTPLLANFLSDVSRSVPPNRFYGNESDMSLHDQWAAQIAQKKTPLSRQIGDEPLVYWIGSSTDYVPFYQHLGITSARLGSYLDTYELGSFHSSLDSPKFLKTFADPHYTTQVMTAKWWGLAIMRFASENLVPFDLSTFAGVLVGELDDVEATTRDKNLHVNFVKLRRAIDDLNTSIERVQSRVNSAKRSEQISKNEIALLNTKLMYFERQFLTSEGLPHRKWFRHLATGSNIYEGFFPVGFPGIADALFFEDGEVDIQSQVNLATEAVERASAFLLE